MKMNGKLYKIFIVLCNLLPLKCNRIYFTSFGGQYNDNPKQIFKELIRTTKNVECVWLISKKCREKELPVNVKIVKEGSLKQIYYFCTSKVIVDNGAGHVVVMNSSKWSWRYKLLIRRNQHNISTWHGTPLKKIGFDEPIYNNIKTYISSADVILAGCEYTKNRFNSAYPGLKVSLTGTPRNDLLFSADVDKESVKVKLDLPVDKKIVLFAPTFRSRVEDSGINQMESIDFEKLLVTLKNKFGGDWIFVFRVHQYVLMQIDTSWYEKKYEGKVFNGNKFDDMAEYLAVTDVLITDYSGSLFDFAITKKPCFLFAPDFYEYKVDRGLYFDIKELPFSFSLEFKDLIALIEKYDEKIHIQGVNRFLNKIGNIEDGLASKRVVKMIMNLMLINQHQVQDSNSVVRN